MEKGIKTIMIPVPPVAFDLDGTLSDSSEGITRSINYALIELDREFDISAGKSAGFRTIGVTWGFGHRKELEATGADGIVDTVSSLPAAIKDLSNATP